MRSSGEDMRRVSGGSGRPARVAGRVTHEDRRRPRTWPGQAPQEHGPARPTHRPRTEPATDGQPTLKRVMGPGLLLLFIVGDVLGTGIYALTGTVAAEVGGVVWLPFLIAFLVALITAFSYLELVTKYPQAAGAALYTHKAFGIHFLTFLVAFAVMSSGITSASTAARAFSANAAEVFGLDLGEGIGITLIGLGFMTVVALVNFRGVGESVKANVVLTCVELSRPADHHRHRRVGARHRRRATSPGSPSSTPATSRCSAASSPPPAWRSSRWSGSRTPSTWPRRRKEPRRIFPKVLLLGPGHHRPDLRPGLDLGHRPRPRRPAERGRDPAAAGGRGRRPGLPARPVRGHHDVRGRQHRPDQHAHGQPAGLRPRPGGRAAADARPGARPPPDAGRPRSCSPPPWPSASSRSSGAVPDLGGTTALLLLMVFAVVNVAVLVLRRRPIDEDHFRTPTVLPVIGAIACAYLATPFAGRPVVQYKIAGVLLALGVVLWGVTVLRQPAGGARPGRVRPRRAQWRRPAAVRPTERPAGSPAQAPGDGVSTRGASIGGGRRAESGPDTTSGPWTAAFLSVHPVSWTSETASNRLSAVLRSFCPASRHRGCMPPVARTKGPTWSLDRRHRERLLRQFHHRSRGARGGPQASRHVHRFHR